MRNLDPSLARTDGAFPIVASECRPQGRITMGLRLFPAVTRIAVRALLIVRSWPAAIFRAATRKLVDCVNTSREELFADCLWEGLLWPAMVFRSGPCAGASADGCNFWVARDSTRMQTSQSGS
jgi:hypothetical protein